MSKLTVNFINETKVSIDKYSIEQSLKLILRRLGHLGKVNIELLTVGDIKMKELNVKYRKNNQSTDVLSFPGSDTTNTENEFTGSIVISVDTAKKQAIQGGITLSKELETLSGHGLLHLLNFHHQ